MGKQVLILHRHYGATVWIQTRVAPYGFRLKLSGCGIEGCCHLIGLQPEEGAHNAESCLLPQSLQSFSSVKAAHAAFVLAYVIECLCTGVCTFCLMVSCTDHPTKCIQQTLLCHRSQGCCVSGWKGCLAHMCWHGLSRGTCTESAGSFRAEGRAWTF
jgi:hypothetical protein